MPGVGCFKIYMSSIDLSAMKTAKLFLNGQSQAVRLPKEFRFAGDEVLIKRVGSAVVLLPKTKSWDSLLSSLELFTPDFLSERSQPQDFEPHEPI
jgi:antitoxin VapB